MSARRRRRGALAAVGLCVGLGSGAAGATEIALSTTTAGSIGGLAYRDGDVVRYDDQSGVATIEFDEDAFLASENVDAFHVMQSGHFAISTGGLADLGGLSLRDGDVADYDPVTQTATLLFDESLFLSDVDVDAFSILPNGHFLLSTATATSLAGLAFSDGDLVAYDPVGGSATLFLGEGTLGTNLNIDAVHAESDSVVIFSTTAGATIGGVTFTDGDLVRYDLATDTATIVFSQSSFADLEDIDAVYVLPPGFIPEPGTGLMLATGLAGLALRRRR